MRKLRIKIGEWFMRRAMAALPCDQWQRWITLGAVAEYRKYERYVAVCQMHCRKALSFNAWKAEAAKMGLL